MTMKKEIENGAKTIAIDGPSASGKSTVSKGVAAELGFIYVDSGAFYRSVTWQIIRKEVNTKNPEAVIRCMDAAEWNFLIREGMAVPSIEGFVPTWQLREKKVREAVAGIASVPEIRRFVSGHLRALEKFGSLVMEGRDIGTVVFPDSLYKFYLDADPKERANRRLRELAETGENEKAEAVIQSLKQRDRIDLTRASDPLKAAPDARIIDSTSMTAEEVIRMIIKVVARQQAT